MDALLLESGDYLLQEDGTSHLLLEQQSGGSSVSDLVGGKLVRGGILLKGLVR